MRYSGNKVSSFPSLNLVRADLYFYGANPARLASPKSKRAVMTKTLEQIQQENRTLITNALFYHSGIQITLTTLLLALYKLDANFGALLAFRSNKVFINIRSNIPWDIEFETLEQQSEQFQKDINKLITDKLIINKLLTNN
jgi:hypothetical protein